MKNIDDMRVGDFLYLIDTLQEECVSKRKCIMCRYHDICDNNDICSISTPDLKKAVEAYAEMNGMLEHMHYANDQKWIPICETEDDYQVKVVYDKNKNPLFLDCPMPDNYQDILICTRNGSVQADTFYVDEDGCYLDSGLDWIKDVVAWMPLPEPYRGEEV